MTEEIPTRETFIDFLSFNVMGQKSESLHERAEKGMQAIENEARADGFMAAQQTMQETVGEAMRDYAERVWAQCSAWHAEQGMGVEGAEDKHNPHTVKNRAKLMEEFGL